MNAMRCHRGLAACMPALLLCAWHLLFSAMAWAGQAPQHVLFIYGFEKDEDLLDPMGLAFDNDRRELYVADTGNGRVCIFSEDGMPVHEYRFFLDTDRAVEFVSPIDVAVNSQGLILVSDTFLGKVIAMNFRGNLEFEIDLASVGSGRISPGRIAVDSQDNIFVADGTNNQVLVFSQTGAFRYAFGKKPEGAAQGIEKINDIFPDRKNSLIYVTSIAGNAVLMFDYDGNLLSAFGIHDSGEPNFSQPTGIAVLPGGTIYIADMLRSDIKVYESNGHFITSFGGAGYSHGAVVFPSDLDLSDDGKLFVLEKTMGRIHIFSVAEGGHEQ